VPARLSKIKAAASVYGIDIVPPNKGSHWKCRRDGVRMYPIPAHNGLRTQVSDIYIRKFCKHFDIDEDVFRGQI